jgi:carbamoyl-phosphate synthase large subunit
MGSLVTVPVENEFELQYFYKKISENINLTPINNASSGEKKEIVVIQEKISGQEFGLDVINDFHQQYITTFIKKKISMRSGETDVAMTVYDTQLEKIGQEIAKKLSHIANLDVDVIKNENGAYILDLNPRFGGGYPFSHLAGANLPAAIISWLSNKAPDDSNFKIKHNMIGCKGIQPLILPAKIEDVTHFSNSD